MTTLLVNGAGLLLMLFIVWWFWLYRPPAQHFASAAPIAITVADGVYTPARIEVARGQPLVLSFTRQDPTPCAEKVIFPDLGISADLPLQQSVELRLTPEQAGEFAFTCQMGMYRGVLIVS
jgi:plastocyanin domain-containing protein